jgi:hypothetical protein
MKKITFEELHNYIISQDDSRPVNMVHNHWSDSCGCVMLHYAADVLAVEKPCAGYAAIYDEAMNAAAGLLSFQMNDLIIDAFACEARTYGELKSRLRSNLRSEALGASGIDFL